MDVKLKENIEQIIILANKEKEDFFAKHPSGIAVDIMDNFDDLLEKSPLFEFLEQYNYETLLTIETIVYVGRDYNSQEDMSIENFYNSEKEHLRSLTSDPFVIADQMESKFPLGKYLQRGLELVNNLNI